MRIVHFADLHLGIDTIGKIDNETGMPVRVLDVAAGLDQVVEYIEDNKPDLILFAGDAYHRNTPNATLIDFFSKRIIIMSKIAPVIIVIGNHDMYGDKNKKTALHLFDSMQSPNVYIGDRPMNIVVGDCVVSCLPYPDKSTKQETFIEDILRLNEEASEYELYRILLAHCSIEGALFGSERVNMTLGNDPIFPLDTLNNLSYDYIALGHIHVLQDLGSKNWNGDEIPVVYPGSLIPLDFSDEGKETGFIEIELDPDSDELYEIDFIPVNSRKFITVRINDQNYDPTDLALDWADSHSEELDGSIVRVIISVDDDYPVHIEDILKYYNDYGCMSCTVNIVRNRVTRTVRLPKAIVSTSNEDLTKLYLKEVGGYKGKDLKDLMTLAKEIMSNG